MQQVLREAPVVRDGKPPGVQPGEEIERGAVLHIAQAGNGIQHLERRGALFVDAPARTDHGKRGLHVLQCGGDDQLCQRVGTQAHAGELHDAVPVLLAQLARAA